MNKIKSISVFFPSYNDAMVLPDLISKTYKILPRVCNKFEVIIVNDGSKDNTRQVVKVLQKRFSYLSIISHSKNRGYGQALKTGFNKSRYEWVFYTDGDGQYDPSELAKLVSKLTANTDVVNGYKLSRRDNVLRIVSGLIYNKIVHTIYNLPISDVDCDFRLIRRELLKKINLKSNSGAICLELIVKLKRNGARFCEVGVNHYKRQYGRSQFFKIPSLVNTLLESLKFLIDRN